MRKYLILAVIVLVTGAYFFGAKTATLKCSVAASDANANDIMNTIKIQRISDEKTLNTATDDIRRILRTRYTIMD